MDFIRISCLLFYLLVEHLINQPILHIGYYETNFRTKQRQATHIRTTFPHVITGQCREAVLCNQIHLIVSYQDT
jgi:hypothetical protein